MGATDREQTIVFFDGVCHLCNSFVDFAISNDRSGRLRFAPLQGKTAEKMLSQKQRQELNTVVVLSRGQTFEESSAILETLQTMGTGWRILGLMGKIIPRFVRDRLYRFIAKRRLIWFGERDFCRLPTKDEAKVLWD